MILKNFKLKKGKSFEEFPCVKLIESEYVFTNIPICEIEIDDEDVTDLYVLDIHPQTNLARVVSKDKLESIISKTKIFHFKSLYSDGEEASKLQEVDKSEAEVSMRLPINTDINKLFLMNGEAMMLEENESEEV